MAVKPKHIDINQEIQDWKEAKRGKEVRSANVSALTKVQEQMNEAVDYIVSEGDAVDQAVSDVQNVKQEAHKAAEKAENAAESADAVRSETETLKEDLQNKLEADYWRGLQGIRGEKGEQGISGVVAPSAGMFSLYLDAETGNLYADYPDGSEPPAFEYDAETGNLFYVTDKEENHV